jgi:hypothetical protein
MRHRCLSRLNYPCRTPEFCGNEQRPAPLSETADQKSTTAANTRVQGRGATRAFISTNRPRLVGIKPHAKMQPF